VLRGQTAERLRELRAAQHYLEVWHCGAVDEVNGLGLNQTFECIFGPYFKEGHVLGRVGLNVVEQHVVILRYVS
jgi:hypothetical protein